MFRRIVGRLARAALAAVLALVPVIAFPGVAHAGYDDICRAGSITDKIDRTRKVYGGAWVTCDGRGVEHLRLRVTLFRNGKAVKHAVCEKFGTDSCSKSVRFIDRRAGKQKWRTKAFAKWKPYGWWISYSDTDWSNVYYH